MKQCQSLRREEGREHCLFCMARAFFTKCILPIIRSTYEKTFMLEPYREIHQMASNHGHKFPIGLLVQEEEHRMPCSPLLMNKEVGICTNAITK